MSPLESTPASILLGISAHSTGKEAATGEGAPSRSLLSHEALQRLRERMAEIEKKRAIHLEGQYARMREEEENLQKQKECGRSQTSKGG